MQNTSAKPEPVGLAHRIEQTLEETRIVTPGTQTFLGFQLAVVFQERFHQLPIFAQEVHVVSLFCILISVLFLILSPAFHRIVEVGEDTERYHTFASKLLLLAMFFLALGIAFDLFVILYSIFEETYRSALVSILTGFILLATWFGLPFILKQKNT